MAEDPRLENARLKAYIHRLQQVCELHRRMGEDNAYEIRELTRTVIELKKRFGVHARHFDLLAARIRFLGDEELTNQLELSDVSLKSVLDLLSRIGSL